MSHFAKTLSAGLIASVLAGGTTFMPMPAEAARISKADRVALKEAVVACKAEARGKKVRWLARRKFVNTCVASALKSRGLGIDVIQATVNAKKLPTQHYDDYSLVFIDQKSRAKGR
jgi:hypothetical protein